MGGNDRQSVQQIEDDTDIFEIIIYTLAPILGGRDQVLSAPFIECVKYVELEQKKRKNDRWNNFMDMIYSSPMGVDSGKRQKYMELIQPEQARKQLELKTDVNQLQKLKEEQERAMHSGG